MRQAVFNLVTALLLCGATLAWPAATRADATKGEVLFKENCARCHSLRPDVSVTAPTLAGVVGRKAGSVANYTYSKALRDAGFVWTRKKIDEWITAPHRMAEGTEMPFLGVNDANQRMSIIDYLEVQSKATTPPK